MSRVTLLSLQVLVAVVAIVLWQVFSTVPVFGKILLPPFFFSNPVDVFSQIVKWFSTGVIWKHLGITLVESVLAFVIGSVMGATAAFVGGRVEALIMRFVDLQLSFPAILLALVLSAILGQGRAQLIIALVTAQYAYFARTAHGAAATERAKDYVEAALSTPLPTHTVLFRHILPNCLPPLIVVATVQVANSIALEATLSFLGLGLPVTEPSLGMLIANGFQYMMSGRYWISIYPGVALIILIVAINLVGDQIRDQLNPRLKR